MLLIEELKQRIGEEQSLFRAQLLKEDIVRLEKLEELARSVDDIEVYKKAARRLGWTQGDARTSELREALDGLLEAVFAGRSATADADIAMRIRDAWLELHRVRMERLIGCLSTPVPRPAD